MNQIQELGKAGEALAVEFLEQRGYCVIERNWRTNFGEIDIIATTATHLVFVEVKTRSGLGFGHPFEAITPAKIERMRKLAHAWCRQNASYGFKIRLDAIAILVSNGKGHVEHLKAVY
ncbi:YraN family protein [Candidatus Rhodoluna planktonica]|uniref:UPF0102 protein A4Z71_02380 n=1 Tax=Candidatus Rhodoluna planktonica TaxID=535712 RepID=A0A1D9DYH2_9MICO|nr:YraN family protein [Candidatus Rhodoluna planktonica]AOY55856.1 hypothetical protein A4Z71_02380 [Candidatus Rhodoluna planktonica]